MMVRVIYSHGGYDILKDNMLDQMLERGEIAGFQRCNGWVVVGRDPIRNRLRRQIAEQYTGAERRGGGSKNNPYVKW